MINRVVQLFFWLLRFAVPLTLVGMLAVPLLLAPPAKTLSDARAHSPNATLVPIGAGESQYTFLRLPDPTFLTVQLTPGASPSVLESRWAMLLWAAVLVMLAVLSWRLWRPQRTPPNNSFKPKPLRGSA